MSDSRFLFKNFAVPVTRLQLGLDRSTGPHGLSASSGPTTVQGRRQQFCHLEDNATGILTCARPSDHLRHGDGSQAHDLSVGMHACRVGGGGLVLGLGPGHALDFSALSPDGQPSAFLPLPTPTREADSFEARLGVFAHSVGATEAGGVVSNSCCRDCRTNCPSNISSWYRGHNSGP